MQNQQKLLISGLFSDSVDFDASRAIHYLHSPALTSFHSKYNIQGPLTSTTNEQLFSTNDLKIFPNPVKNTLNIQLEKSPEKKVIANFFSLNGQKVMSRFLTSTLNQLDVQQLKKGAYIIQFEHEGQIITKKINSIYINFFTCINDKFKRNCSFLFV